MENSDIPRDNSEVSENQYTMEDFFYYSGNISDNETNANAAHAVQNELLETIRNQFSNQIHEIDIYYSNLSPSHRFFII